MPSGEGDARGFLPVDFGIGMVMHPQTWSIYEDALVANSNFFPQPGTGALSGSVPQRLKGFNVYLNPWLAAPDANGEFAHNAFIMALGNFRYFDWYNIGGPPRVVVDVGTYSLRNQRAFTVIQEGDSRSRLLSGGKCPASAVLQACLLYTSPSPRD